MKPLVLIAEGDAKLRDSLGRLFREHDYEVATASDGLDCVRKLRQQQPRAVVLDQDLRWGGSDGVLAVLREDPALRQIPVILTLAGAPLVSFFGLISPPVVQSLWKPFSFAALLHCVRVVAGGPDRSEKKSAESALLTARHGLQGDRVS
jgi:CheY-like chemotaxis protein